MFFVEVSLMMDTKVKQGAKRQVSYSTYDNNDYIPFLFKKIVS